jgi:uncharacterized membrane protein
MVIEPNIVRQTFTVDLVKGPLEGEIILALKDKENKPVYRATVSMGDKEYMTDNTGTVKTNLRRGKYVIKADKPGFETMIYTLEVRGGIYYLENLPQWAYLMLAVAIIALLAYSARRREKEEEE